MQCVLFEETNGQCLACVYTSKWKADQATIQKFCKTDSFSSCPRYCAFMEYQEATSTLKLKSK